MPDFGFVTAFRNGIFYFSEMIFYVIINARAVVLSPYFTAFCFKIKTISMTILFSVTCLCM